jgi:predicted MPP superfamily phosphohydrolase
MNSRKPTRIFKSMLFLSLVSLLFSCSQKKADPYSFFVAGHTYGGRGMYYQGLHPPFEARFDLINERGVELGFLTGDIVVEVSDKDWDEVDSVLRFLNARVYFAAGNHDVRDREMYERRYGKTFLSSTIKVICSSSSILTWTGGSFPENN